MEKINLAELLKDCPKGMELDCTMFDNLVFSDIDKEATGYPIIAQLPNGVQKRFTSDGRYELNPNAKCVIFPKGKTTWEGFAPPCKFKDGDIVATTNGRYIGITTGGDSESSIPTYCVIKFSGEFEAYFGYKEKWMFSRLATVEEKETLFDAIKSNGYRWNAETKTLEKLIIPKFKVGDCIIHKKYKTKHTILKINKGSYTLEEFENEYTILDFDRQDEWEIAPNKFDITTLKPFDKVLVRDSDRDMWCASIFSHTWKDKYFCIDTWHKQCIPYEANKELLGTTNECDEFYKTW